MTQAWLMERSQDKPEALIEELACTVGRLRITASDGRPTPAVLADNLRQAFALLNAICPPDERSQGTGGTAPGGLAAWQIRRIEAVIDSRLDRTIRVADLAAAAQLSASYLTRACKVSLGCSPTRYVMRRRVERAKQLLSHSAEPLSQIALDCGFADQAHFTRAFHKAVGAPPRRWRMRHLAAASVPMTWSIPRDAG